MYGLPQAEFFAEQLFEKRLEMHGYKKSTIVPGFWNHQWCTIQFNLVVGDFGVKHTGKEHAKKQMSALKEYYKIFTNWEGKRFIALTLDWDYQEGKVHL